jgi:predicted phosphate transport protein (TIGR00153 family)
MKFRIVPSTREFFDDFKLAAQNMATCVEKLEEVLADTSQAAERHAAVKEVERTGDELTSRILTRLDTTFVTPFDPEDIQRLAQGIDDVVDDIYHVSEMVVLTNITDLIPEVVEQVEVLDRMSAGVIELFESFEDMRGLRQMITRIEEMESEGNRIYRRAVARLFSGEMGAIDVIRWKDIVESLEAVLDRIEDMTNIVTTIVVKQA